VPSRTVGFLFALGCTALTAINWWHSWPSLSDGHPFVAIGGRRGDRTGFKLWPLTLAAWLAGRWHEAAGRKAALSWLTTAVVVALPWFAADGVEGVEQVVTFRGATGWQVESIGGAAIAAKEGLASVLALLVFAPILSPQSIAWMTPAIPIAVTEGHRLPALLAACAIPLTVVMMLGYRGLMAREDWAVWLIVLRNVRLVVAFAACAAAIWRGRSTQSGIALDSRRGSTGR
jgi:hypothetical protein